jgi:DNA-binding response OmpR family regulator
MKNIVVIDDEQDILEILNYNLTKEIFNVKAFSRPLDAIKYIKHNTIDLIISDWLMPELDGLELCRLIKGDPLTRNIPIIMISCKGDEIDIVTALEIGAEDYLVKPFHIKELIVRVKKIIKRYSLVNHGLNGEDKTESKVIIRNDLKIDLDNYAAFLCGKNIELTYSEYKLIKLLASKPGKIFTRDDIISAINGDNCIVTERAIDVQVVGLRKKLGTYRDFIETIRSVGYRFKLV